MMHEYPSDIAFTDSVKALQVEAGSRNSYAKMESGRGWETQVTPELAHFLLEVDMFYLATANAVGQPYIQYRGGAPGFLKVIDETTLGFADFAGNKQFISAGNVVENPKACIFLMDYEYRRRAKLWGTLEVVRDDPALLAQLHDESYPAKAERVMLFRISAWDLNCPQHIHRRLRASDVEPEIQGLQARVKELEVELAALRG